MRGAALASSVLVASALASAPADLSAGNPWQLFEEFKEKYSLHFGSQEEDAKRFRIFEQNLGKAQSLNKKSKGKAHFGITKFSHLSPSEFRTRHTGFKPAPGRKRPAKKIFKKRSGSIDWREISLVTPVKDQGQCGSCWAFSATEALETGYWKNSGSMKILSAQQTVSCDREDLACNGGDTTTAYEYMQSAGGVETESDYPYVSGTTERRGTCKADSSEFAVKLDSVHTVSQDEFGESDMFSAIMTSPMSICVDASSWQLYWGGVVDSSTCGTDLDHCVQVVGIKSGEYWIVKNQWAEDWGESGYIRVKTGENACGIAMEATMVDAEDEMKHVSKRPVRDDPTEEIIEIIEGISEGFGLKMERECIDSSSKVVDKIEKAVELMQERTTASMMKAFEMLEQALRVDWPAAASACAATAAELSKILASLEILRHPKQFAYHVGQDLIVNGVDIYKSVNAAVGFWKEAKYEDFGYQIGEALNLLIVGAQGGQQELYV
ncbi:unnamed protein product [Amoebophrya sp. A25]|nr:unnamed protein product [Amoebophrya sp. A25]|eukprot:GSA25T00021199001.1